MGGRGASAGIGGGGAAVGGIGGSQYYTISAMVKGFQDNGAGNAATSGNSNLAFGGYTANGNQDLAKWQAATDTDKMGAYLHKVDNFDVNSVSDKWAFYDNPYQKMVLSMGLNDAPIVMSDSQFNQYVKQTGQTVMYRGWSSRDSADRFTQSQYSHTGTGVYGDGFYFTPSQSTARSYGSGAVTKMALSPNARVVDYHTLVRNMNANATGKVGNALRKAGSYGSRSYGANDGEAQWALKMGYNVVKNGSYYYALTRDALVVSSKY